MAFIIVLHHPLDPHQPWANAWEPGSDHRIQAITTTAAIGRRADSEGRVFVHRCGFDSLPPAVVAEAKVTGATPIDRSSWFVTIETMTDRNTPPPAKPTLGTFSYEAEGT